MDALMKIAPSIARILRRLSPTNPIHSRMNLRTVKEK